MLIMNVGHLIAIYLYVHSSLKEEVDRRTNPVSPH